MRAVRAAGRRACVCTGLKCENLKRASHLGLPTAVLGSGRRSSSSVCAGAALGNVSSESGSGTIVSTPSQRLEMARTK